MRNRGCRRLSVVVVFAGLGVVLSIACLAALFAWLAPRSDTTSLFRLPQLSLPTPGVTAADLSPTKAATAARKSSTPAVTAAALSTAQAAQAATSTPALPPSPTALPTPIGTMTLVDPTLKELNKELAGVKRGQIIEVRMSEATLDAEIRAYLSTVQTTNYRYRSLSLGDGTLTVAGQVQLEGVQADAEITASPHVSDCWFDVEVTRVKLGLFPAPRFLRDQLAAMIKQYTAPYAAKPPVCVQKIILTDEAVTFVGMVP
jgi:hypothetical protein